MSSSPGRSKKKKKKKTSSDPDSESCASRASPGDDTSGNKRKNKKKNKKKEKKQATSSPTKKARSALKEAERSVLLQQGLNYFVEAKRSQARKLIIRQLITSLNAISPDKEWKPSKLRTWLWNNSRVMNDERARQGLPLHVDPAEQARRDKATKDALAAGGGGARNKQSKSVSQIGAKCSSSSSVGPPPPPLTPAPVPLNPQIAAPLDNPRKTTKKKKKNPPQQSRLNGAAASSASGTQRTRDASSSKRRKTGRSSAHSQDTSRRQALGSLGSLGVGRGDPRGTVSQAERMAVAVSTGSRLGGDATDIQYLQALFECEHQNRLPARPHELYALNVDETEMGKLRALERKLESDIVVVLRVYKTDGESPLPPSPTIDNSVSIVSDIDPYGVPNQNETPDTINTMARYEGYIGETDPLSLASSLTGFPVDFPSPSGNLGGKESNPFVRFEPGVRGVESDLVHKAMFTVEHSMINDPVASSILADGSVFSVCTMHSSKGGCAFSYADLNGGQKLSLDEHSLPRLGDPIDRVWDLQTSEHHVWIASNAGISSYLLGSGLQSDSDIGPCHRLVTDGDECTLLYHRAQVFAAPTNSPSGVINYWNVDRLDEISSAKYPCHGSIDSLVRASIGIMRPQYSPHNPDSLVVSFHGRPSAMLLDTRVGLSRRWYFGHTAAIENISTSEDLPNLMVTASSDRSCKVWDARQRRALLTLEGHQAIATTAALALVDGRPVVFSGGGDECIRVWDIGEFPKPLYEISTGNNLAQGLWWSQPASTLVCTSLATKERYGRVDWPIDAVHQRDHFPSSDGGWTLNHHAVISYRFNYQ